MTSYLFLSVGFLLSCFCFSHSLRQENETAPSLPGSDPFACIEVQDPFFPAQKSTETKPHRKSNFVAECLTSPHRGTPSGRILSQRSAPAPYPLRRTPPDLFH